MGAVRSGSGRSGAQALPLTRRQQKRARQQQAQRNQRRQTQQPQAVQSAPHTPSAPLKATSAPSSDAGKVMSATPKRPLKTLAASVSPSSAALLSPPASTPTMAATAIKRGRKYPTLARMVAVAARSELADAPATAETPHNDAPPPRDLHLDPEHLDERSADDEAAGGLHPEMLETLPVPAIPLPPRVSERRSVPTRRLALSERSGSSAFEPETPRGGAASGRAVSSGVTPLPLPELDLVLSAAAIQVGIGAAAALIGAGMLLAGSEFAFWPFVLAAISAGAGWLAYLLTARSRRWAALLLLLAQFATLAWLLALAGARASLLALAPLLALLALRWLGHVAAYVVALAALALYALAVALQMTGALAPALTLSASTSAPLDVGFVAIGLLGTLLLASRLRNDWLRAEVRARAGRYEIRTLRANLTALRQQVDDDSTRLEESLARVLAGRAMGSPVESDGALSALATTTNAAAERLAMLHLDREDRLRLEGAVRTVTQAVERAWLGLPWSWPEWSGTALDELVALLRAPRPHETRTAWPDEVPTLKEIPALERDLTPRPWERTTPISVPVSIVRPPSPSPLSSHTRGWPDANATPLPTETEASLAAGLGAPAAQLPWDEWNTWRDWIAAREE